MMMTFEMAPRKPKTFKLDERLLDALQKVSDMTGESVGSYVEMVLWKHCQGVGQLPITEEPIHDQRGGKRPNSGRKKSKKLTTEEDS